MKKFLSVSVLLVVLMVIPSMVMAYVVNVTRTGGYYSGLGGEFTLSGTDIAGYTAGYDPKARLSSSSIQSFCVETDEHVSPGGTYYFKLSNAAIEGGSGGPSPDPLSKGAAYLYAAFALGILSPYDYTVPGRDAAAGDLQNAIWYLEQESGGSLTAAYTTLLTGMFGSVAAAMQPNNGQFAVKVMNLYNDAGYTSPAQDQLVYTDSTGGGVPIPPTIYLLGAGLLGLVGLRRKFKK